MVSQPQPIPEMQFWMLHAVMLITINTIPARDNAIGFVAFYLNATVQTSYYKHH